MTNAELMRKFSQLVEANGQMDDDGSPVVDDNSNNDWEEDDSDQWDVPTQDNDEVSDGEPDTSVDALSQAISQKTGHQDVQGISDAINNYLRMNKLDIVPTNGLVDDEGNV
jgi:hypothetical protein